MQTKNKYISKLLEQRHRLSDTRFIGQGVFVVIVLLISWSGVKTIQTNYDLQKKVTSINQQNQIQTLQNDNLALQNEYFNTNQYLELSARENFGLASPGEKEVVVPEQVAMAYTVNVPSTTATAANTKTSAYQQNLTSWIDFFLHKQN